MDSNYLHDKSISLNVLLYNIQYGASGQRLQHETCKDVFRKTGTALAQQLYFYLQLLLRKGYSMFIIKRIIFHLLSLIDFSLFIYTYI